MKFRYEAARPGANSLVSAFSGRTRQDTADETMKSLANVDYLRSRMGESDAKARDINQRSDYLGNQDKVISDSTGIPLPLVGKFTEYMKHGDFGQKPLGPDESGNEISGPGLRNTEIPADITPLMESLKKGARLYGNTRSSESSNPIQLAQAAGEFQGQDATQYVQDKIIAGDIKGASAYNQGSKLGNEIKDSENVSRIVAQSRVESGSGRGKQGGKLPVGALRLQQDELDAIGTASSINSDMGALSKQIDEGKIKLGLVENLKSQSKNYLGSSDESSRNFASLKSSLEKMRNDSLRLNKGVQTEGDSVRAWNELFQNLNDTGTVKQRLGEIQKINQRAVYLRKMNLQAIRSNYGLENIDTEGFEKQPAAVGGSNSTRSILDEADAILRGGN